MSVYACSQLLKPERQVEIKNSQVNSCIIDTSENHGTSHLRVPCSNLLILLPRKLEAMGSMWFFQAKGRTRTRSPCPIPGLSRITCGLTHGELKITFAPHSCYACYILVSQGYTPLQSFLPISLFPSSIKRSQSCCLSATRPDFWPWGRKRTK